MGNELILAINPGSTSTKVALFDGEKEVARENVSHSSEELKKFDTIFDQIPLRRDQVVNFLEKNNVNPADLAAVSGRGGPIKPLPGGVYEVTDRLVHALKHEYSAEHPSLLGGLIAREIADSAEIKAYIVDPVSVDEFHPLARVSGLPEIPRKSLAHALNIKAVARRVSADLGKDYKNLNLVIAHLGGGISITAHENGCMIDVNNANDGGPFSPERTGTLPMTGLIEMCYSGKMDKKALMRRVLKEGGLSAHLGTNDAREVEKRIETGDSEAKLVYEAMAYTISKEIAAMASVLKGRVDAVVLSGGLAASDMLINWIEERTSWISKVMVYPGEDEMPALSEGVMLLLRGEIKRSEFS